ncbi:hypothetical protein [Variovorax saccharolyticus]|uniref:hypothetical protein n=1 Tax=Variovorax saccharolyticus TaxID=3053516 RepID=UPI002574988C|nr:hypothetical protein [Variovorax sp. J31P216]MDM0027644.1 hypothetical protein [Variovorax sp. J31P216]
MTHYSFVHLEFGNARREPSIELLARFREAFARPGDRVGLVIVDNARTDGEETYSGFGFETARVIPGDNSNREFSGWDAGVAAVLAHSEEPEVWIFTNDTVARHQGWSPQRAARFGQEIERLSTHAGPWILGEVNDYVRSVNTPLGPQLEYIVTYGFAMNNTLRKGLVTLSPGNEFLDSLVHDSFEPARKLFRDHVDPGYAETRLVFMVADPAQMEENKRKFKWRGGWYKASPLSAENFADMRMKLRCVVSETLLSVRARQLGADIRSPYDARNGRQRVRKTLQFFADKLWERRFMRRLKRSG